jgi:hypothetical protein
MPEGAFGLACFGGGSVHKINKLDNDMSEVGLCPFMIVLLSHKGREAKG